MIEYAIEQRNASDPHGSWTPVRRYVDLEKATSKYYDYAAENGELNNPKCLYRLVQHIVVCLAMSQRK